MGGAEVVKAAATSSGDFGGGKSVSAVRLRNVARCYAWWIAKDAVSLSILKVNGPLCSIFYV